MVSSPQVQTKRRLRKDGSAPVFRQLASFLMQGGFVQGERLPSEHDLAAQYDVSRVTVRKALGYLQSRGLIYSEHGRGSFVRPENIVGMSGFGSFTKEVLAAGANPSSKVLSADKADHLPEQSSSIIPAKIVPEGPFHRLTRLRYIDQTPCLLERSYLPDSAFPGFQEHQFSEEASLYDVMEDVWGVRPCWADAAFAARSADEVEAEWLDLQVGQPVMSVLRVTSADDGEVLEVVDATYRDTPIPLTIKRHRFR